MILNLYVVNLYEPPYAMLFMLMISMHIQNWWPDGNNNADGIAIESLLLRP